MAPFGPKGQQSELSTVNLPPEWGLRQGPDTLVAKHQDCFPGCKVEFVFGERIDICIEACLVLVLNFRLRQPLGFFFLEHSRTGVHHWPPFLIDDSSFLSKHAAPPTFGPPKREDSRPEKRSFWRSKRGLLRNHISVVIYRCLVRKSVQKEVKKSSKKRQKETLFEAFSEVQKEVFWGLKRRPEKRHSWSMILLFSPF